MKCKYKFHTPRTGEVRIFNGEMLEEKKDGVGYTIKLDNGSIIREVPEEDVFIPGCSQMKLEEWVKMDSEKTSVRKEKVNITLELTSLQAQLLKRFAERQYAGARDNKGTYKPIHLVEDVMLRFIPFHDDVYETMGGDIVFRKWERYADKKKNWKNDLTECVKECYKDKPEMLETIRPFVAKDYGSLEQQFNEYLSEYALCAGAYNDIEIAICVKQWYTKTYCFTLAAAQEYIIYQDHNLCEPRTYTVTHGYGDKGDYEPFWDVLMKAGEKMLETEQQKK